MNNPITAAKMFNARGKPEMPGQAVARPHTPFADSAKLEHLSAVALAKVEAIKANLPASRSAQRKEGRGLGYGG